MTETVSAMEAGKIPAGTTKMQILCTGLEPKFTEVPSCHLLSDPSQCILSTVLKGYKHFFRTFSTMNQRLREMREFT